MDERPRRRSLTPLSGELEAQKPVVLRPPRARRMRRKPRQAPTSTAGALLNGLRRFVLGMIVLGGATAGIAGLVVWLGGADSRMFKVAFYAGGALLAAIGVGVGSGTTRGLYYSDRGEREVEVAWSAVYVALGVGLIVIGFALDVLR